MHFFKQHPKITAATGFTSAATILAAWILIAKLSPTDSATHTISMIAAVLTPIPPMICAIRSLHSAMSSSAPNTSTNPQTPLLRTTSSSAA